LRLSRILDNRKDGSRGALRIDYGDPRKPEKPIAWMWKFIVCRARGYAESMTDAALVRGEGS
jgi:hypothetical protein